MDGSRRAFALELADPLATAEGRIERREGWLVTVSDGTHRGWGEATPLPGWTESRSDTDAALEWGLAALADGPAAALEAVDGAPAARHGLSLALADLRARRAGTSLARHLAEDEPADAVAVNATLGDASRSDTVAAAEDAVSAGFDCLKCKVGTAALPADLERLRAVREAVGEGVSLRADANGAWSPEVAEDALGPLGGLGVDLLEQPVPAGDLGGLARLRGGPVPVGADEALATHGLEAVVDADAADVLVCKPMVLGGPDRVLRAARTARAAGCEVVVSTTVDGAIARAGALQAAAALAPLPACGLATGDRLRADLVADPPRPEDGELAVPPGPGLGIAPEDEP